MGWSGEGDGGVGGWGDGVGWRSGDSDVVKVSTIEGGQGLGGGGGINGGVITKFTISITTPTISSIV